MLLKNQSHHLPAITLKWMAYITNQMEIFPTMLWMVLTLRYMKEAEHEKEAVHPLGEEVSVSLLYLYSRIRINLWCLRQWINKWFVIQYFRNFRYKPISSCSRHHWTNEGCCSSPPKRLRSHNCSSSFFGSSFSFSSPSEPGSSSGNFFVFFFFLFSHFKVHFYLSQDARSREYFHSYLPVKSSLNSNSFPWSSCTLRSTGRYW